MEAGLASCSETAVCGMNFSSVYMRKFYPMLDLQGIFCYFDIFYCLDSILKIACGGIFYPGKRVARS
jgi:hypothetical protein